MPAIGGHGCAECFGTPARFVCSLLLQLSVACMLRIHFDGQNRAAAAKVLRNEMEGTDSMSPVAESASSVAADVWHRPHEVVFTSKEALQENNVPVDTDILLLPSNRVRLPDVTRSVKPHEFAERSSELPHMHPLVVLPANSPEQMLVDGRCRYGNLYVRVRLVDELKGVLELEVDSAFVPQERGKRLQLHVDSVVIKDGVPDNGSDALLLCSEVGENPVLIALFPFATSNMPRFSPEPFSLLFKPQQIDVFRSASPNSAVLQIKGAVEGPWPTSSRDGGGGHTEVVNYLARVDDPTQFQILQFLDRIVRSSRCHLERRTLGEPVIFLCEDADSTLQDITSRTRVSTAGKKLASNSLSRVHTTRGSDRSATYWRLVKWGGALLLMLAAMSEGAARVAFTKGLPGDVTANDFNNGFTQAARARGYGGGVLSFLLDAARPSNLYTSLTHLLDRRSTPAQQRFSSGVLLGGAGLYGAAAAAWFAWPLLVELLATSRKRHGDNGHLPLPRRPSKATTLPTLTQVASLVTFPEKHDKTVIYAVVP